MSNLKTILFPLIVALLVMAGSAYAIPSGVTPSNCPANVDGCNPPINVSLTDQIKKGALTIGGILTGSVNFVLGGNMGMKVNQYIDLNSSGTGRSTPESQIGATASNLNIYGVGSATAKTRKVTIFDSICDSLGTCKTVTEIVNGGGTTVTSGASGMNGYCIEKYSTGDHGLCSSTFVSDYALTNTNGIWRKIAPNFIEGSSCNYQCDPSTHSAAPGMYPASLRNSPFTCETVQTQNYKCTCPSGRTKILMGVTGSLYTYTCSG